MGAQARVPMVKEEIVQFPSLFLASVHVYQLMVRFSILLLDISGCNIFNDSL